MAPRIVARSGAGRLGYDGELDGSATMPGMLTRRALLAAVGALALPRPIPPLPITLAVAGEEGAPVRDAAWVDAQVAQAVALFSPLGIPLRKVASSALPADYARLETRADRDALAERVRPRHVNVFVVASLRDVDDPALYRMGVHWRSRAKPAQHYAIVAATARAITLAHELGHFFGLDHTSVMDNVMSYEHSGGPVFFDDHQAARMRSFARMYVRGGLLEPAPPEAE
jgi:hypothetical protein